MCLSEKECLSEAVSNSMKSARIGRMPLHDGGGRGKSWKFVQEREKRKRERRFVERWRGRDLEIERERKRVGCVQVNLV